MTVANDVPVPPVLSAAGRSALANPGTAGDSTGTAAQAPDLGKGQRGQRLGPTPDRRISWTAPQLLAATFPAPRWAVPGVIAEGLTVLAGAPKVGKSWLGLGLAVAVATGGTALGRIDLTDCSGPVLYLALEDTPRRLQARLEQVLAGNPPPENLTISTECPPLPAGGSQRIADWCTRHTEARLVVIDVFARVRGPIPPGVPTYQADYTAVSAVKRIADKHAVAVLLVHHTRQASADDWMDTVSGTNGVVGAADTVAVLARTRGQADAVLRVTGRDIDDAEHPLRFDAGLGAWQLLDGPAEDYQLADTRRAILRYVRRHPGARPKAISTAIGVRYETVKRTCARMAGDNQITSNRAGGYTDPLQPVPPVPDSESAQATDRAGKGQQGDTLSPPVPDTEPELDDEELAEVIDLLHRELGASMIKDPEEAV